MNWHRHPSRIRTRQTYSICIINTSKTVLSNGSGLAQVKLFQTCHTTISITCYLITHRCTTARGESATETTICIRIRCIGIFSISFGTIPTCIKHFLAGGCRTNNMWITRRLATRQHTSTTVSCGAPTIECRIQFRRHGIYCC